MSEKKWIPDMVPCAKCKQEFSLNALSPEGECFACSTGDGESRITETHLRESMANVARDLGNKTNLTGKSVAKRVYEANKADKSGDKAN